MIDLTKRRTPRRVFAPLVWACLGAAACSESASSPTGPRLVVLYSTCTLGTEYLSPYSPTVDFTPNLQRFADEGVVFRRHITETGQSGIAFASLYAGVQADRHGVFHHPRMLADELYLVTEAFADHGYEPHFWSGHPMAAAELAYGQGVPEENLHHRHAMFTKQVRGLGEEFLLGATANDADFDAVLAGLLADPERHAYVQINFTITHELYQEYVTLERIEDFRRRFPTWAGPWSLEEIAATLDFFETHRHTLQLNHAEAVERLGLDEAAIARLDGVLRLAYAACVEQLDEYFGRFLERIRAAGLAEDSLIAFTADHGETFHHESQLYHWMHGLQLAPTVLQVPWIVRAPGLGLAPGSHAAVTRSIDVYPTLAGLCGLVLPEGVGLAGQDLAPALRGEAEPPDLLAFMHTTTLGKERVRRYEREGHTLVQAFVPEPTPEHMWVGVRAGDMVFKLRPVEPGRWATVAYDLASDPTEAHDLFDLDDPEHRVMKQRLAAYKELLGQAFDPTDPPGSLSQKEMLERLQAFGYVGDDPPSGTGAGEDG